MSKIMGKIRLLSSLPGFTGTQLSHIFQNFILSIFFMFYLAIHMTKLWDHLNLKNSFSSFFFYFLEELIYYRLRAQHFPNHLMESGTEKI